MPGRASALRAPRIAGCGRSSARCSERRVDLGRWRSRVRGMLPSARAPERPCSRAPVLQAPWESQCRDGRCIKDSHAARRTPGGLGSANYSASTYVSPSARAARRTPRVVAQPPVLACCGCWPLQACGWARLAGLVWLGSSGWAHVAGLVWLGSSGWTRVAGLVWLGSSGLAR